MKQAYIWETMVVPYKTLVEVPDDYTEQQVIDDYKNDKLDIIDSEPDWFNGESKGDYEVEFY